MRKSIIRLAALILIFILFVSGFTFITNAETTVYPITEITGKYKTQGRTIIKDDLILLDWSASGIEFVADCSGKVDVTFDAVKVTGGDTNGLYFTVIVDGEILHQNIRTPKDTSAENWKKNTSNYPFCITKTGEITFTIAENLNSGRHTFEIYKQSEANYDVLGIKSIALNGELLEAPKNNDIYIEVIGDSIAAAASNLTNGADGSGSMYQNATQGWPYMTARSLNADWSILAKSGIMASKVANHTSMQTAYKLQRYYANDNKTLYNFEREPDVIIVCLGTNDVYHSSAEEREKGIPDMLTLLREKNPNSKIVWIHGMMTQGANSLILSAIEKAGGWHNGYYTLSLAQEDTGHPKMDMQYIYTKELTKFIKNVVLNPEYKGENGLNSGDSIIYRATDSMNNKLYDETTQTETSVPYLSSADTIWKFGVSGLGDNFKTSDPNFKAPVAKISDDGNLNLSWERPYNAVGKTTIKIIGDTYCKELLIGGESVTLTDAPKNEKLQIQVTIGNVSSKVLTYYENPVLTKINIVDSNGKITTKINPSSYLFADLRKIKNNLDKNTGILIKLESVITNEEIMVTHYFDKSQGVFVERNQNSPVSNFKTPISLNDIGFTFTWKMTPTIVNENNTFKASNTAYANNTNNRTRNFYAYDYALSDRSVKIKNTTQNSLALGQGLYQYFFKSGYILIPFESFNEADLLQIKETGIISLKADTIKYRGRVVRNNNGNQDVDYLYIGATSLDDTHTNTNHLSELVDRELHYSEIAFINDYDTFVDGFVNDTSGVITTPQNSTSTSFTDITYMIPTNNKDDYNLTNELVSSSYLVDDTNLYKSKIIYSTAIGEKMKLGFTAAYNGAYLISAPIRTEIQKAVHYRLIKETKDGIKSILQEEKTYSGEKCFCMLNTNLLAGDTVYFEAWSEYAGTQIDIGVPQVIYLENNKNNNSIKYIFNEHIAIGHLNDFGYQSVWSGGTFINPFTIGNTSYKFVYDSAYLSAVENGTEIKYDGLNLEALNAVNVPATSLDETDGSALYNAFCEFDGINVYSEGTSTDYYYQTKDGAVKNYYDTDNGYSYGDPLRYNTCVGILTANKTPSNTDIKIRYGFGLAAGGGARNVYINFGQYQQFTAPDNGNAILDLGGFKNYGKVIVLHNKKVVATYLGGTLPTAESAISLNLLKGDTISIAYTTVDNTESNLSITDTGNISIYASVTFTENEKNESEISFDSKTDKVFKQNQTNGTEIILPTATKAGAIFNGWVVEKVLYNSGDKFTVNKDAVFKADFAYYGDLNDSGEKINAEDLLIMRKILLNVNVSDASKESKITADLNNDKKINLTDLIRLKKYISGIDVSIGVQ